MSKNTLEELEKKLDELERLNLELAKKEARYRLFFDNAIEGIFLVSLEGKLISVNRSCAKLFGFDSEEELFENFQGGIDNQYVNLENRETLKKIVEEQGNVQGYETEFIRKDGGKFWASLNILAVKDNLGNILCFQGFLCDISEKKKMEEELYKQKKFEGVLEMAGAVCHELNQPLQIIMGHCELLMLDIDESEKCFRQIKIIQQNTTRLGALTAKIMSIARYAAKPYLNSNIVDIQKASGDK